MEPISCPCGTHIEHSVLPVITPDHGLVGPLHHVRTQQDIVGLHALRGVDRVDDYLGRILQPPTPPEDRQIVFAARQQDARKSVVPDRRTFPDINFWGHDRGQFCELVLIDMTP